MAELFKPSGVISLLTDFGLHDDYVGLLHAVISSRNKHLKIIDLCHDIPSGHIDSASFLISTDYSFFPIGTVHVCVVDPGVGSSRSILVLNKNGHLFIAPDNGLLTDVIGPEKQPDLIRIEGSERCLDQISNSFHGRDIFAPVAADLASDYSLTDIGKKVNNWVKLVSPLSSRSDSVIRGRVRWIDRFGNLITDIPADSVVTKTCEIQEKQIRHVNCFADGGLGELVWLKGSRGTVELVINGGSAELLLHYSLGAIITFT